jgi:hypothetical protein
MTPAKEQNKMEPSSKFLEAERMIKQTIADMDNETHIEYGSTMERKSRPTIRKALLRSLKRKKQ